RMHLRATDRRATRLERTDRAVDWDRRRGIENLREPRGQLARRAARGVDLVVVRVVDDLPLRDQLRRELREAQQQHGGEREIAAGELSALLVTRDGVDLRIVAGGKPRRADDDVLAAAKGSHDVGLRAGGLR